MNNVSKNKLILRQANKKDEKLLLEWTNDPTVRQWSFVNSQLVEIADHKKWFKKTMDDKNIRIWIIENEKLPCGQVRIEKSNNHAVLHYSIAVNSRGKNLGSKMLKMAVYKTCHEWKGIKILAYTVPENIASNKSLEKAGFSEKSSNKKEKCFVYKCS